MITQPNTPLQLALALLFFGVSMFTLSCSGNGTKSTENQLANLYSQLEVGNEWVYAYDAGGTPLQEVTRVTGTEEQQGHTWYVVETQIGEKMTPERQLLRTEGSRLILYRPLDGKAMTLIDFARTEADKEDPVIGFVQQREQNVEVRGGKFEHCVVIGHEFVDAEVATYAPSIGLVRSYWFRGNKELIRARIGGREIGDL